jgi:RNA polymerase sigma-70 factor, ECF subfamily
MAMDETRAAAAAIDELYRAHQLSVLRYLRRLVHDSETAEDLCHETFVKALRSWEQLRAGASAQAWLFRIARNTAYDHLRRHKRIALAVLDDDHARPLDAQSVLARLEDAELLREALRDLPEHYRLPLLLHGHAGYGASDIAAALGCTAATIRTRLYRARAYARAHASG